MNITLLHISWAHLNNFSGPVEIVRAGYPNVCVFFMLAGADRGCCEAQGTVDPRLNTLQTKQCCYAGRQGSFQAEDSSGHPPPNLRASHKKT